MELNELKIVHISAMSEIFSKDIHLMLITKNCLRIFLTFETNYDAYYHQSNLSVAVKDRIFKNFFINFVKSPIILSQTKKNLITTGIIPEKSLTLASTKQSRKMIYGYVDKNTCFMIDSHDNIDHDEASSKTIYFYSQNLSKIGLTLDNNNKSKKLIENAGLIKISSDILVQDLEISHIPAASLVPSIISQFLEIKRNENMVNKDYYLCGKTGSFSLSCLNDLSKQVYLPASHYLFLTSESLDLVLKARPIDFLFQIMSIKNEENKIDENHFNRFSSFFGGVETCCMLLQLICNKEMLYYFNESLDQRLKEGLFIRVNQGFQNDQKEFIENQQIIRCRKTNEDVIIKAINTFFKLGDAIPINNEKTPERRDFFEGLGKLIEPEKKTYTYKIEAFLLYLSRIIRPLWNKSLVNQAVYENIIYDRLENFKEDELQLVRSRILEIKNFMDAKNERLFLKKTSLSDNNQTRLKYGTMHHLEDIFNHSKLNLNFQKGNVEEILWDEKVKFFIK